mgnify:CR=1 FL=1
MTSDVVIRNRLGLHARAAAKFVHLASRYQAQVRVSRNDRVVDGKSIMHMLTLGAEPGVELRLEARGDQADEALGGPTQLDGSLGEHSIAACHRDAHQWRRSQISTPRAHHHSPRRIPLPASQVS